MTASFSLNKVDRGHLSVRHHTYVKYWKRAKLLGLQIPAFQWLCDHCLYPHFKQFFWIHFCVQNQVGYCILLIVRDRSNKRIPYPWYRKRAQLFLRFTRSFWIIHLLAVRSSDHQCIDEDKQKKMLPRQQHYQRC